MKRLLKKSVFSILIVMILFNFISSSVTVAHAADANSLIAPLSGGLVGLLTWVPRVILFGITAGLHTLVTSLAKIGDVEDYTAETTIDIPVFNATSIDTKNLHIISDYEDQGRKLKSFLILK